MNESSTEKLRNSVNALPALPGVYLFLDSENRIIYTGKAKNLKKRVSSYFFKKKFDNNKLRILVKQIRQIDHIVVETESDALLLENNLIKEYKPRYNVLLKDDKSFPYICIKNEPFPRVFTTRNPVKDGSLYYGPYTSVYMVRTILELLRQLYPLRNCKYHLSEKNINSGKFKVCLEYHIGNCKGPCVGKQSIEEYDININHIKKILKGNINGVKAFLKERMQLQAGNLAYEEAQNTKEKLAILERYQSKSTIVNPLISNLDVYSFIDKPLFAVANYLKVVNGAVIQSRTIEIKKVLSESKNDLLALCITEVRSNEINNASEIVVPFIPDINLQGVKFTIPVRGDKKRLLDLSNRNALYYLKEKERKITAKKAANTANRILETAMKDMRLKKIPRYIECFDNSNIQGYNPVSACVVFRDGKPSKGEYRHYNIKNVQGPDDYASMKEVIYRRYRRLIDEGSSIPQLIVVDGGKAQLGAAVDAITPLGIAEETGIVAIAKKLEEIYFPGDPVPLYLDKKSETLRLIQHLRNEAHRFSLMFHRQKRSSGFANSILESVPGLGAKTIEKLYKNFRTYESIMNADFGELSSVIGKTRAKLVIEYFKEYKKT
ncbi:MAG: excinuclease ABC subunit UvrC [Bacteroidales bacterium]